MRYSLFILLFTFFTASSINDARKANREYENGNYEEAAQLYRQAISEDPDNAKLHFNLGNTLYKMGDMEAADEAFNRYKTLIDSPVEESYADYNVGRMLTDMEQYDEAVQHFREALKKNPDDADARYNYELALQKQKEEQQQQDQQDNSDDSNDQQDNNQNQDDSDNDEDQQQNQDQNQNQQPQQPEDQQDQNEQPQPAPVEMTEEEAENILDALRQLERELLENRKKESTESQPQNEKDW